MNHNNKVATVIAGALVITGIAGINDASRNDFPPVQTSRFRSPQVNPKYYTPTQKPQHYHLIPGTRKIRDFSIEDPQTEKTQNLSADAEDLIYLVYHSRRLDPDNGLLPAVKAAHEGHYLNRIIGELKWIIKSGRKNRQYYAGAINTILKTCGKLGIKVKTKGYDSWRFTEFESYNRTRFTKAHADAFFEIEDLDGGDNGFELSKLEGWRVEEDNFSTTAELAECLYDDYQPELIERENRNFENLQRKLKALHQSIKTGPYSYDLLFEEDPEKRLEDLFGGKQLK